jgi:hypothetical protein
MAVQRNRASTMFIDRKGLIIRTWQVWICRGSGGSQMQEGYVALPLTASVRTKAISWRTSRAGAAGKD